MNKWASLDSNKDIPRGIVSQGETAYSNFRQKPICLIIIIALLLSSGILRAQYTDKTPSVQVSGSGLYSTAGGDLTSGLAWLAAYADRCYGGIGPVVGTRGAYDSMVQIANYNPTLAQWWGLYTNVNHMIVADTVISGSYMRLDMVYDGMVHVFDSLDAADGTADGSWNGLTWEACWFHYADDSVLATAGATNVPGWPVTWSGAVQDDESPTATTLGDTSWLSDSKVQYTDTCMAFASTDDWSLGFYYANGARLAGVYIYDTAYSAGGFYSLADSVLDLYVSEDNFSWTLQHASIIPGPRQTVNTAYNKYAVTWYGIDYTDCDEKAYHYYKLHCPTGPLRDVNGNYLQVTEVQPTGRRRMIKGTPVAGVDSTARFAVFSNSLFDWGDSRSTAFAPTGAEQVPRFDLPKVDTIIALAHVWILDKSDSIFAPYDTLGVKCFGIDNMFIGTSGSGTNLASYWSSKINASYGGTYPSDVEWELGRSNTLADYGDTLKAAHLRLVEVMADFFETKGYRIILNVSNSAVDAIAAYYHVANDSVVGMGKETGGTNLLYYVYSDATNFTKVLTIVDTAGAYSGLFNVEYRMMIDADDNCDVIYPGYSACNYALYSSSTARLWGEWMANYIMGVQLTIQHANTSFDYSRALYSGGDNLRWYKLFEYDFGDTVDSRHDTTISGYQMYYRNYDSGQVWWFPGQTVNSYTDTSLTASITLPTGPFYWIYADSTEAWDSTYFADSTITLVERHAYILNDASEAPATTQEPLKLRGFKIRGVKVQ